MDHQQCEEPRQSYKVERGKIKVSDLLIRWSQSGNFRAFPWRHKPDPYLLLMTELMLRRTQAPQVLEVQKTFLRQWPKLEDFLFAKDAEIIGTLKPLGLTWRMQNFLELRDVLGQSQQIPTTYSGLKLLPGVGDYVASAVLCFSGLEARPLIDTNIVRVICRYEGLPITPGTRRLAGFRRIAERLMPKEVEDCALYHYALLDLAAKVCKVRKPLCAQCPLVESCGFAQLKECQ